MLTLVAERRIVLATDALPPLPTERFVPTPRIHASKTHRPHRGAANRTARPAAPARGPAPLASLRGIVGNQLVRHMLLNGGPNPAAVRAVQRQPANSQSPDYGLDLAAHQGPYVARALELWKSHKDMTTDAFIDDLMKTIKAELVQLGVPDFKWKQDATIAASGEFDSHEWIVRINPSKFTKGGKPVKVKDFPSFDEFVEVVGTLYHESRHTDQDLMIVRVLLEEGQKPADIVSATNINDKVVAKIKKAKFPAKPNKAQAAQVHEMYGAMYGEHKEPLEFVMKQKAAYNGVVNLTDAVNKKHLAAAKPHIAAITKWRADVLAPGIVSQKPKPSPVEQRF
jgi:hypothetical protein